MKISGSSVSRPSIFLGVPLLLALSLAMSCHITFGVDDWTKETRSFSVGSFSSVSVGSAISLTVNQGSSYSISVSAPSSSFDKLDLYVSGSTLYIDHKPAGFLEQDWFNSGEVDVTVTMPALVNLDVSGASSASVNGPDSGTMTFTVSGASNLHLSSVSGNTASFYVSGASVVYENGGSFSSGYVDVSGASVLHAPVVSSLTGNVSGASTLYYKGAPWQSITVSGASTISHE